MHFLKLSSDLWLNLDDVLTIKADADKYTKAPVLLVSLKHTQSPLTLSGDHRRVLLGYLATYAIQIT